MMTRSREDTIWLMRSASLPVQECLSHSWKDFQSLLHNAWRESTQLANWASHTLARLDVVRTPAMKELPPLGKVDLYALAFGRARPGKPRKEGALPLPVTEAQYGGAAWEGAKIAAASLLRWVETKYRKERGKVIWRRERRTPEFLYPVPFPVHQQSWTVSFNERGQPMVYLALPGARVALRLRNGPDFAAGIEVLKRIEAGDARPMELKLCRQSAGAPHRRVAVERAPGGGQRSAYRIMVRIAYQLEAAAEREGPTAECRTGADPFLTLVIPGSHEWLLHAPWVRNWIIEHRRFLDAFADDLKYEKRWPGHKRKNLNRYRERRCEKHARRMKTFLQQTASQVVAHAVRRGASAIQWDDTNRSFVEEFPWFLLAQRIEQKCVEAGLRFHAASGAVVNGEAAEEIAPSANGVED